MESIGKETDKIHLVGGPENLQNTVREAVVEALRSFQEVMQYEGEVNVVVFESQSEFVIPEIGLMGRAIGKGGLEIYVDFERTFAAGELEKELAATVYHEATHLAQKHFVGFGKTLVGVMISEGVACYVERCCLPDRIIPYIEPIENEMQYLEEARPIFNAEEYEYGKWFFGSPDFPKWVGYRLGFLIVEAFMKKTKLPLYQLVRTEIQEILTKSEV